MTRLSSFTVGYHLFKPELSKSYGITEWRNDLRKMFTTVGVETRPVVFLLDDPQIVSEAFLDDVNKIVNTGEVPNLFSSEELTELLEALAKCEESKGGIRSIISPADAYPYLIKKVQTNLHVVLCLSPTGDTFRLRLRKFPSLINCCTIDWFDAWPEEALQNVAWQLLDTVDIDPSVRTGVVDVCVDMQKRVCDMAAQYRATTGFKYYTTPTSYLELIKTFKNILHREQIKVLEHRERYDNGLLKFANTEKQVSFMQTQLEELQTKLVDAANDADALLTQITSDTKQVNESRAIVENEETLCREQEEEASKLKEDCEKDLSEALPALEAAVVALQSLFKSDIVEVKSMKNPPHAVKLVLEAVCLMMDVKPIKVKDPNGGMKKVDDFWVAAQKHLIADPRFLQNLISYDRDNMASEMVDRVRVYTNNPDFNPDKIRKGSVAAAGLCKWVHAMVAYDHIARLVAPKRAALLRAESDLKVVQTDLIEMQGSLQVIMERLGVLKDRLMQAEAKKTTLEEQFTDCRKRLRRAHQLISGLGRGKVAWSKASTEYLQRYNTVVGDALLASGLIAYMGAFTSLYRNLAIDQWKHLLSSKGIKYSDSFSLEALLGDAGKVRTWVIDKLPNDSVSIENAIMLLENTRWPLMIDPQGQAIRWVKKMEALNRMKVVKQNDSNLVRTVEISLQLGTPILLENILESVDPVLEPVLLIEIITVGGVPRIRLGDNVIEYNNGFRLYLATKLRNPHYPPELCAKVNLLNFTAVREGLEDQMLSITVSKEEPELEAKRETLILEDAENRRIRRDIDNQVLSLLQCSEGNILDDETLIEALEQSNIMSNNIEQRVHEAATMQAKMSAARECYAPVASHVAHLFFCISDLELVDPMYLYSLEWFVDIFKMTLEMATSPLRSGHENLAEHLLCLNARFTLQLYRRVCRSLFEKDKLLFSFLLTTSIMQKEGRLGQEEFRFFLQGAASMELQRGVPASLSDWLSLRSWQNILAISQLPSRAIYGIDSKIENDSVAWKEALESLDPMSDVSALLGSNAFLFQALCVIRSVQQDVVIPAIHKFVASELGVEFVEPPPLNLMECYTDSSCSVPLLFVLTPGADPMTDLEHIASELGFGRKKLTTISLGQGQGPHAEDAITEAVETGTWVCLQNCHLCLSWINTLDRICADLSPDHVHENFRCLIHELLSCLT